jgi:hypothetical protein
MGLKRKLISRKFWALIAALVTAWLTAAGANAGAIESVIAIIGSLGACVAYIFAEASVDAARGSENNQDWEEINGENHLP